MWRRELYADLVPRISLPTKSVLNYSAFPDLCPVKHTRQSNSSEHDISPPRSGTLLSTRQRASLLKQQLEFSPSLRHCITCRGGIPYPPSQAASIPVSLGSAAAGSPAGICGRVYLLPIEAVPFKAHQLYDDVLAFMGFNPSSG